MTRAAPLRRFALTFVALCAATFGSDNSASAQVARAPTQASTRTSELRGMDDEQRALIASLLPSVVNIVTVTVGEPSPGQKGIANQAGAVVPPKLKRMVGSGFVVDPSGFIVTNRHVIEGGVRFIVSFADGTAYPARLIAASTGTDVAVLKIDPPQPLAPVRIGDSDAVRQGDTVIAIGNPLGLSSSVSMGIVSALDRDIRTTPEDSFIQTDATVNHGNSGGPLFNLAGEVIGVNTAIYSPTADSGSIGLNFAIPIDDVSWIVRQLHEHGSVRAGSIGIEVQSVTHDLAQSFGYPLPSGALVSRVDAKGGAFGKLKVGDIIEEVDGDRQMNARNLRRAIAQAALDAPADIKIWRDGTTMSVDIPVRETADSKAYVPPKIPPVPAAVARDLGMTFARLDAAARQHVHLPADSHGVVVASVAYNGEAEFRQVEPGDVILTVQRMSVSTPADVRAAIEDARQKKAVSVRMLLQGTDGPYWVPMFLADPGANQVVEHR